MIGRPGPAMVLAGLLAAGCGLGGDAGWVRFNADDQDLTVQVGPGALADPQTLTLLSTTESVEIGEAVLTPGGGPVGTEHSVIVTVLDAYEEQVGRVTVLTEGERGTQTHLLVQDSADPGLWQVSVQSLGAEDETREDVFTIRLWTPAGEDDEPDPEAEVDGD